MGPSRPQRDDYITHVTGSNKSGLLDAGAFPGEHPVPVDVKAWIDKALPYVSDKKWTALVNGKTPASLLHYAEKNPDLNSTRFILERQVLSTPGVTGITLALSFDSSSRTLTISGEMESIDGEIDFTLEIQP